MEDHHLYNGWMTVIWTATGNHHLDNYLKTIIWTPTVGPSSGLDNYWRTIIWTRSGGPLYVKLLEEHHIENQYRTIIIRTS
jgi:hypothetical protein